MAVVISRSAVIRHVLPTPAEPAAVDQIGQQVADRASDKDGGERVLLNRTAHGLRALADGAARARIAAQSVADVTRTPLVGVLRQLRSALGDVSPRLCGLSDHAEALLGAIKDVLGDAATDEILAAWGEAYWLLADVLIAREGHLYRELAAAEGGWTGWRDFTVAETRPESDIIRSFI